MKAAATIVCAGTLAILAHTAAAAAPIVLLSPNASGTPPPPLAGGPQLGGEDEEVRVPGALDNVETVRVGLGSDGRPASIVVVQRMKIRGLGDFRFVVPAPATAAAPLAGSQSMPGLRQAGIVWQGFSPGKRLLAARMTLIASSAAAGLPIRISVEHRGGVIRVRLVNTTSKQFTITDGRVSPSAVTRALAQVRAQIGRQIAAGRPVPLPPIELAGSASRQTTVAVDTPVRISGAVAVAGARTAKVDATLGGGRPATRTVQLHGEGNVTIALEASFAADRRTLLPTATELAASADPLRLLQVGIARGALALQYEQYLASPKPDGASSTTYLFRTMRSSAAPARLPSGSGGSDTLWIVLGVLGGIVALGGLTVLWAHM
jgi:hypothetical protein